MVRIHIENIKKDIRVVLDYNKFEKEKNLTDYGLLYVLEQMP